MEQEMNEDAWQFLKDGYTENLILINKPCIIYSSYFWTNIDTYTSIHHKNWLEAMQYKSSFMCSPRRNYFQLFKIHVNRKKCHRKIAQDFSSHTLIYTHSLIFLPLLDIYFVHLIHVSEITLPSQLQVGGRREIAT